MVKSKKSKKNSTKTIRAWSKIMKGQFKQKTSPRPFQCKKCLKKFKSKEGLASHDFHIHTYEGKRRREKKVKKKNLTESQLKQRRDAAKSHFCKVHRSEAEKISLLQSYDQALHKGKWCKEHNLNAGRITELRAKLMN